MNRTIKSKRLSAGKLLFVIVSIQISTASKFFYRYAQWRSGSFAPSDVNSGRFICDVLQVARGCCGSLRPFCCAVRAPLSAFFTHQSKQHTPDVH